ncbi:MAG: GTP-binding protein [Candidatus Helarchaeota archaeon]
MSDETYNFKLIMVGSGGVGKTSLIKKYVENTFSESYKETIGVNILIKDLKIDNKKVQLLCWDVAGQEKFGRVRQMYYRGASAAMVVYDVTKPSTYLAVPDFVQDFRDIQGDVPLILIGNKVDLRNEMEGLSKSLLKDDLAPVSREKGLEMHKLIKSIDFIETSAKTGEEVEAAFEKIARELIK